MIVRLLRRAGAKETSVLAAAALWLCNPFTVTISTRGSCDVLAALLLLALLGLLSPARKAKAGQRTISEAVSSWPIGPAWCMAAAVVYGLVVHLRIYPIIFAPAIVLNLAARSRDRREGNGSRTSKEGAISSRSRSGQPESSLPSAAFLRRMAWHAFAFGSASAATFLLLGAACFALHGQKFLDEAFLHHLTRRDHRHNFSPHFYPIYLGGGRVGQLPMDASKASDGSDGLFGGPLESIAAASGGSAPSSASVADILLANIMSGQGGSHQNDDALPEAAVTPPHGRLPDVALLTSIVQMTLQGVLAVSLHGDLPGCLLIQTMAFVALNKVG